MRFLAVLSFLLGACDLQPPPKSQPSAPAQPAAPAAEPPAPPTESIGSGAPAVDPIPQVSEECLEVAAHVAGILIANAKDPAQKAALEQDRTKIIRRTAEGCTRDAWSSEAQTCFLKAKTTADMQVCGKNLRP